MYEDLKNMIRTYYDNKLNEHGISTMGVDWNGSDSQKLRFRILSEITDLNGKKIHDVGCGLGHMVEFLKENAVECDYVGSDISHQMIMEAKERLPGNDFFVADIFNDPPPSWMRADYVLASGVFHVRAVSSHSLWRQFVEAMIQRMFELCERGISFNVMSSHVDYREPHLFYFSPAETFNFCVKTLSRRVVIRHDYPLYEYTVYVYR